MNALDVLVIYLVLFYELCDYGESVATAFTDLYVSIYDLPWHLGPTEMQEYVAFMLKIAQRPVYLHGFYIDCSCETFKKVRSELLHIFDISLFSSDRFFFCSRESTRVILISCCYTGLVNKSMTV